MSEPVSLAGVRAPAEGFMAGAPRDRESLVGSLDRLGTSLASMEAGLPKLLKALGEAEAQGNEAMLVKTCSALAKGQLRLVKTLLTIAPLVRTYALGPHMGIDEALLLAAAAEEEDRYVVVADPSAPAPPPKGSPGPGEAESDAGESF